MRHLNRIVVFLAIVICGVMTSMAQRDIKLKLNKLNFENFDTVKVEASFVGFEDDPVVGDVIADIVNPHDSIIQSVVMHRSANGIYYAELPVPLNELNTHEDILKLCHLITLSDESLIVKDKYVGLVSPDFGNYGEEIYTKGSFMKFWGIAGAFREFQKVPFSQITYISVFPYSGARARVYLKSDNYILYYEGQKSHPIDNVFSIQVSASLQSGEVVAGMKKVTMPVIEFTVFRGDKNLQISPNNIRHDIWVYGKIL